MDKQNYYELLGVDYDADRDTIKQAYDQLRERYADDRARLNELKEAWRVLGSHSRRRQYDEATGIARSRRAASRIRPPARTDVPRVQPASGLRPPAKTDVPGMESTRSLRQPAKTDVPGVFSPPRLRPPAVTDVPGVQPGPGLRPPAETDIQGTQPVPDIRDLAEAGVLVDVDRTQIHQPDTKPTGSVVTLDVQPARDPPWSLSLAPGEYLIGRGGKRECGILLPDPEDKFISREHATLRVEKIGCSIRDEHSLNGTRVEGVRITPGEWVELRNGDEVKVEDYVLIVRLNVTEQIR
jgi:hypothetical protein